LFECVFSYKFWPEKMKKVKILVVGGTGYLGQHLLQAYAHANGNPFVFDLAFTHHSSPPPHLLVDAIPSSIYFQVDLKTGVGFEAISNTFGQVLISPSWLELVYVNAVVFNFNWVRKETWFWLMGHLVNFLFVIKFGTFFYMFLVCCFIVKLCITVVWWFCGASN